MIISLIAAMAENRAIGIDNQLPWRLPADLRHFKQLTLGKPIVMGRNTWESLPGLLPERQHIVLTRNPDYAAPGAKVTHDTESALSAAGAVEEIMIVGGAEIYRLFLPLAKRIYLTLVKTEVAGDAFFPKLDENKWRLDEREGYPVDKKNPFAYEFLSYSRTAP